MPEEPEEDVHGTDRPNVLWIQTDELRADALGCYGNDRWPAGHTPNLDALAARGVRFDQAYCNSPVCVPSRTSVLSGRYPHELGVWHNDGVYPNRPPDTNTAVSAGHPTFPEALADSGYRTVSLGKTHTPLPSVWQEEVYEPHAENGYHDYDCHGQLREQLDPAVLMPGPPYAVMSGVYPSERTPTTELTDLAVQWLESEGRSDEPWLLRVSYLMPHTPVMPPPSFAGRFDPADFAYDAEHDTVDDAMSPYERYVADIQRGAELSPDEVARARASYWDVVAHLDDEVGRVLSTIDDLNLTGDTIVVFDTDHGTMLGELGVWQKHVFADPSLRVPLIMSWPGHLPEDEVRSDINELVDRGRTLLGLCGVEPPEQMRGRNVFGTTPATGAAYAVIGSGEPDTYLYALPKVGPNVPRRFCIRTTEWRYEVSVRINGTDLSPDDPARQPSLIDLASDPSARHNVAGQPEYADIEKRLAARLEEWASLALAPASDR